MADDNDSLSFYHYDPSEVAAGVLAIIFVISFLVTAFQIFRRRSWVWLVFLFAIGMEALGFAARLKSARDPDEQGPFAISFLLILLAPVLMAGVIYTLFGRIVFWVVPPHQRTFKFLWVPARFITLIFVGLDIISLVMQTIAGALIAGTDATDDDAQQKFDLGQNLGLIGVAVQLAGFGLFSIIAIRFHFTSKKAAASFTVDNMTTWGITRHWSALLLTMNITCFLILVRSCFRMVEFAQGADGGVHSQEWYLYVFDAAPVAIAVLSYNIVFPGTYLKHLGFRLPKHAREGPAASDTETMSMKAWNPQGQASQEPIMPNYAYSAQHGQDNGYYGLASHEPEPYRRETGQLQDAQEMVARPNWRH